MTEFVFVVRGNYANAQQLPTAKKVICTIISAPRENNAPMVLTTAGDWNVDFFKKNGYLLRGELKDVPKGHDCYELYKMI